MSGLSEVVLICELSQVMVVLGAGVSGLGIQDGSSTEGAVDARGHWRLPWEINQSAYSQPLCVPWISHSMVA